MAATEVLKLIIEGVDKFSGPLGALHKGLGAATSGLGKVTSVAKDAVGGVLKLTAALTAAAAAMSVLAVKAASEFQYKMAEVSTLVSGVAEKDLPAVKDAILELSTVIPKSTSDLSGALYQTISAGYELHDSLELVKVAAKGSVAGLTETKTAVDGLTTVLSAYGESASQANKYMDIMFQTVKEGKINFEQLSSNIGTVSSMAKASGISFEETSAAVAVLTKNTGLVSESFTYLRGAMVAVAKPTDEAVKAMVKYGIASDENAARNLSLMEIIEQVSKKKLTLNQIMEMVPEQRAAQGVLILANNYRDLIEVTDRMKNSQGAMLEAYEKMMNTFHNKLKLLWNSISNLRIIVGEGFVSVLTELVEWVKEGIDAITQWVDKTLKWREHMERLGETLGNVKAQIQAAFQLGAVSDFQEVVTTTIRDFLKWATSLEGIKFGLKAINVIIGGIGVAISAVRDGVALVGWLFEGNWMIALRKVKAAILTEILEPLQAVTESFKDTWVIGGAFESLSEKIRSTMAGLKEDAEAVWATEPPRLWTGEALQAVGAVSDKIDQLREVEIIPRVETGEAKAKIDELKKEIKDPKNWTAKIQTDTASIQKSKQEIKSLKDQLAKATDEAKEWKQQFQEVKDITDSINRGLGELIKGIGASGSMLEKWFLEDKMERLVSSQVRLIDAQANLLEERARLMRDPESRKREHVIRVIQSDMTWVDGFIRFLLDRMKITIEEEGFECLCSV